jgi:hypothetical protein
MRASATEKEALCVAGESEHRSIANKVPVMVQDYCGRSGIPIQKQEALSPGGKRKSRSPR